MTLAIISILLQLLLYIFNIAHVHLMYQYNVFFVVTSPWGWWFIAEICRRVQQNCTLLCHYAASSGNLLAIFRDKFSVPSSWVKISGPISCSETSVGNCHYPLRNNPEERSSYLIRGGGLNSSTQERSSLWMTYNFIMCVRWCM